MDIQDSRRKDVWQSGPAYELYVGRWSRLVAREFLSWLSLPPGSRWLDVGCGTGALTQTILQYAAPAAVEGVDRSPGFIEYARAQVTDERARFQIGNAQALPVEPGSFDAVVSGLALNFFPDPGQAAAEIRRAARPGGKVAAYVWDYAREMQFMRHFWDAATALDPAAGELDEGPRFTICQPDALESLFRSAGLSEVQSRQVDIATDFKDFDDYWAPFLGGQGPAPAYTMSLSEERRAALRERLRASLPVAGDGSISLIARTWAVQGVRQQE